MATSMIGGLDLDFGLPPNPATTFSNMDGDEYVRCARCAFGGCDVRVAGCGCTLHARCIELNPSGALAACPLCHKATNSIFLLPMSFREIDEAHRSSADRPSKNRKRKADEDQNGAYVSDRRTGRWTSEEMAFCDKIIVHFESGQLPVEDGSKLNEFLGSMLKSKQSRLTKKMKNAKLSSRLFQRTSGFLDIADARLFSELEEGFVNSVSDIQERAEIKFHMQKEWREQFSRVCATIGQPLDADSWLNSVEEMDRRTSQAKNAARTARRKLMMGVALRTDSRNPDHGVFIERTEAETLAAGASDEDAMLALLAEEKVSPDIDDGDKANLLHSGPFLTKVISYLERHSVPFEHVDLWVPSYVPGEGSLDEGMTSCRLCYAGSATVNHIVLANGKDSRALTKEEKFDFMAFGDYSQKFSFDVGCGLPGRVYDNGRPCWEQSVHNAPHQHFERCGGAHQWGVKTVVGLPIASPNVGRIVATLYSSFDRAKDEELVSRMSEELTRLMPAPKWKLVVDIGHDEASAHAPSSLNSSQIHDVQHEADLKESADFGLLNHLNASAPPIGAPISGAMNSSEPEPCDTRIDEVVALLGEFMPSDPNSPLSSYVPGFMSLRLLLLRQSHSAEEAELVKAILDSYTSFKASGRERSEIAGMLARDFMFLSQQQEQTQPAQFQKAASSQSFLGVGQGSMVGSGQHAGSAGLSLFGPPSTSSSLQNSPALTPIPAPGSIDALSIVSN